MNFHTSSRTSRNVLDSEPADLADAPARPAIVVHMCKQCWYLGPERRPVCPSCGSVNSLAPAEPEMCVHYFRTVRNQPPLVAEGIGRAPRNARPFGGGDDEEDFDGGAGGDGAGAFGAPQSEEDPEEEEEDEEEEEEEDDVVPVTPATFAKVSSFKGGGIVRLPSSDAGVDHVFSGGIPQFHAFMLAASPGGGKSTLCRQLAAGMAELGFKVMIAAGEEVGDIANEEFKRLRLYKRFPKGARAVLYTGSDDTDAIIAAAKQAEVDILFVDSLSILSSSRVQGAAGEKTQVNYAAYHLMQAAHASNEYEDTHPFTVIMISHVTKDGSMAGPNKAKHWTDGAFGLEHIDPNTLEAVEDQEKGATGYVRLRILGKYRRGNGQRHCYFQLTDHGLVPWIPKNNDDNRPGAPPLVGAAAAKGKAKGKGNKATKDTNTKPTKGKGGKASKDAPAAPEKPAKGSKKPATPKAPKRAVKPAKKASKRSKG